MKNESFLFTNLSGVVYNRSEQEAHTYASVSSGDRAMVSGTMCRGFESLQMRFSITIY